MWNNYIGNQIRRSNRHLLVMNICLVAILLVILLSTRRYLYNCFAGPAPITADALAAIKDPATIDRYFVSISGVHAVDTGLQSVEKRVNKYTHEVQSETRSASYFATPVGSKMLLIKSPASAAAADYEGALVMPDADVREWFDNQLKPRGGSYDTVFLPYIMDATPFRTLAYVELALCVPLLLLGLYNILKGMKRRSDFNSSPIAKSLSRFGPAPQIAAAIDGELAQYGNRSAMKGVTLTVSWFLRESYYGLKITPANNILWAYQKVTKRRTNGIPTGTTFSAVVADRDGKRIQCSGKQATVTQMIEQIKSVVPWIITGYSADANTMYSKRRNEFAAAVEQRKQEFLRSRSFHAGPAAAGM